MAAVVFVVFLASSRGTTRSEPSSTCRLLEWRAGGLSHSLFGQPLSLRHPASKSSRILVSLTDGPHVQSFHNVLQHDRPPPPRNHNAAASHTAAPPHTGGLFVLRTLCELLACITENQSKICPPKLIAFNQGLGRGAWHRGLGPSL